MTVKSGGNPAVVSIGSINLDLAASVERLPRRGETILAYDFQRHFGGKGANQAVAAAKFGARAAMVGCVGDDGAGAEALEAFDGAGVDRSRVRVVEGVTTGTALITVGRGGENTIVVVLGANDRVEPAQVEDAESLLAGADAILLQFEVPTEVNHAAARLVERLRSQGSAGRPRRPLLVVNPSPFHPEGMPPLEQVDVLMVNEVEAEQITGKPVADPASAARVARELLPRLRAGGCVVVTLGGMGAVAVGEEGVPFHVPALAVDVVDTTGAGDVFTGAFTVELCSGRKVEEALRFANAAGALCVTRPGAQGSYPSRAEVEQLLPDAPSARALDG